MSLGPKCSYTRLHVRNLYDKYVWEYHVKVELLDSNEKKKHKWIIRLVRLLIWFYVKMII